MGDETTIVALPRTELTRLSRRELLKLSPLLLGGALFVPAVRDRLLRLGVEASDAASLASFRRTRLAPVFADSALTPFESFPYNSYLDDDPGVDLARWRLTITGAVRTPVELALGQITALPRIRQNTRHVCIEGWSAIGSFTGARVADVLALVGADPGARFVHVRCADDYETTLDLASACHAQSLLCYAMYDRPLDRGHGAPLRLQMPTKLGYKQAKYVTRIEVLHVLPARLGTWEDRGYAWHGGL